MYDKIQELLSIIDSNMRSYQYEYEEMYKSLRITESKNAASEILDILSQEQIDKNLVRTII